LPGRIGQLFSARGEHSPSISARPAAAGRSQGVTSIAFDARLHARRSAAPLRAFSEKAARDAARDTAIQPRQLEWMEVQPCEPACGRGTRR